MRLIIRMTYCLPHPLNRYQGLAQNGSRTLSVQSAFALVSSEQAFFADKENCHPLFAHQVPAFKAQESDEIEHVTAST